MENKGQLLDGDNRSRKNILFYGKSEGVNFYISKEKVAFVFTKRSNSGNQNNSEKPGLHHGDVNGKTEVSRIELNFINSNPEAEIITGDQRDYKERFYYEHCPDGIMANTFKKVTYKNIYPNIDLILDGKDSSLKYSFIVYPGGRVEDIKMKWAGTDSISASEIEGKYFNALGYIHESNLVSSSINHHIIKSVFLRMDNITGFIIDNYDKTIPLIIDPDIQWGTFYGGADIDRGNGLVLDTARNSYITGWVWSDKGFATSGAYQTTFTYSGTDAYIVKFSPTGSRTWATYYGGIYQEEGFGIDIDSANYVYITGYTASLGGIATAGAYQTTVGKLGYEDAFLAKFSSSGALVWGTYFGGEKDDEGLAVHLDQKANVYICGTTLSSTGVASKTAFQSNIGGSVDGFLAKFSSKGVMQWSTYYGGSDIETCRSVYTDSNSVYMAGTTVSSSGIATSGAYQSTFGGSKDGFLCRFSQSGSLVWGTYLGGTNYDELFSVTTSADNSVCVTGSSYSSGLASTKAYQTTNAGYSDIVIAKFSKSGSLKWCTLYGGSLDEQGDNIITDSKSNIYITGYASSANNIATTGTYQQSKAGSSDAFISKFSPNGFRRWATYYGGTTDDFGTQLAQDKYGYLYLVGHSHGSSGIATSGAFQTSNKGSYDIILAKFDSSTCDFTPTINGGGSGCQNSSDTFSADNHTGSSKFFWNAFGGTIKIGQSTNKALVQWYSSGRDSIQVTEVSGKNGCRTTTYKTINVILNPNAFAGTDTSICIGDSIGLGETPDSTANYKWSSNPPGFTSKLSMPYATPLQTTTYYLKKNAIATGCSSIDSVTITVNPLPQKSDTINYICRGTKLRIGGVNQINHLYSWTSKPAGFLFYTGNPLVSPITSTTYYLNETIQTTGCSRIDSTVVVVNPDAISRFFVKNLCLGDSDICIDSSKNAQVYKWDFGDGSFSGLAEPKHKYLNAGNYTIKQWITTSEGCKDSASKAIIVKPTPKSDIQFTDVCPLDTTIFTNNSISSVYNLWYFGDGDTTGVMNPKHLYKTSGVFPVSLKVINSVGCSDSSSKQLTISDCVWPGDANHDKLVDLADFIAVGIAYGNSGYKRAFASLLWTSQVSRDWSSKFSSGLNFKHADCNGDSLINYADTIAIAANYGYTHPKSNPLNQGKPSDPVFEIRSLNDTIYAGDTLAATIQLGDGSNPVQNLYGFKFAISADPLIFDLDKATFKMNNSFLGKDAVDLMSMQIKNSKTGHCDMGVTRIDQKNTSGFGQFATLFIPVKLQLPQQYNRTALAISDNLQFSLNEKYVPLYFKSDSMLVKQHRSGIENKDKHPNPVISVFPNPFQNSTTVEYEFSQKSEVKIALYDVEGRQLSLIANEIQPIGKYKFEINSAKYSLSSGLYSLRIIIDNSCAVIRIVKL